MLFRSLVDGVLLLVDSSEGPLPQTRFVLKKALELNLSIILVINKVDRPDSRIDEVINEVYDLFIDLDANEDQIEFPIIYTNAKAGIAYNQVGEESKDLKPLLNIILKTFKGPEAKDDGLTQFLVTNLDYDPYVGQIAVGRLNSGSISMNSSYAICRKNDIEQNIKSGAAIAFAHGLNVHFNLIEPRNDIDVFMVAPKGPGHTVRAEYQKGGGVPCLLAVHLDSSGNTHEIGLSYACAVGGGRSGIIIHTFEIKSNLILISNPIRAYAYPKCKKPIEKTIKRKLAAPPVWAWDQAPARACPGLSPPVL